MAHKPNDVSRQFVKNLSRVFPKTHIAKYLKIDYKTLMKHYEDDIIEGERDAKQRLLETAFDIAITDRNVTMVIFLLKTWVGLSEDNAKDAADELMADPLEIKFDVKEAVNDIKVIKGSKKE